MDPSIFTLAPWQRRSLLLLSFFIVAFGQPVWSEWLSLVAASLGFACFWRALLSFSRAVERFYVAIGWFAAVQIVQLAWMPSHPYIYIYGVVFFCAWLMGAQWGLIAIWIRPSTLQSGMQLFALAGAWILLEKMRLFILSGLPFNPVGLTLTGSLYPLQLASIGGIYGLSFWVILTNLFVLRAWLKKTSGYAWGLALFFILMPYLYGYGHIQFHEARLALNSKKNLKVVLVQTALPIEESLHFQSAVEARQFVLDEWQHILLTLQKQVGRSIDLIVFPENLVPYGTYYPIFPVGDVQQLMQGIFGNLKGAWPVLEEPQASFVKTDQGERWLVSNAYLAQTLANFFQAHVVIGLEDSVYVDAEQKQVENYSAAFHFMPENNVSARYEKRVLVPMGEYIPFKWCQELAARYGIKGSFTAGRRAQLFNGPVPLGPSICYEEIYGDLMRENRKQGAELLVNLTNDGWYPHSLLPKQHFDHARLRTVENGVPLVRACNTGITGAIDSLGRIITLLGKDKWEAQEIADSLYVSVPTYHYSTLYAQYGDRLALGLASLSLLGGVVARYRRKKM